jgi:hypothetical protein
LKKYSISVTRKTLFLWTSKNTFHACIVAIQATAFLKFERLSLALMSSQFSHRQTTTRDEFADA